MENTINQNLLRIQDNLVKAAKNRGHSAIVILLNENSISNVSNYHYEDDPCICICDIMMTTGLTLNDLKQYIKTNGQSEFVNPDM